MLFLGMNGKNKWDMKNKVCPFILYGERLRIIIGAKYQKKYKEKPLFSIKIVDKGNVLCYIYSARLEKRSFFYAQKRDWRS